MNEKSLKNLEKRKSFTSENQPGNAGRKKNRFKQIQNDFDLSIDDMRQVIIDLLSMSPEEIKTLKDNKDEPAYRLVIASAIFNCIKTGNWTQVNYMFDRLFGKAKETVGLDANIDGDVNTNIVFNFNKKEIDEYVKILIKYGIIKTDTKIK